tara:strand:- start:613 stop:1578 length:966 start_codon:yes stop_codon:yes gene_type:complete
MLPYLRLLFLFNFLFSQIDYETDIQSIFNLKCTSCHGNSAGLNLSSYDHLMAGGNSGNVVIPFDHANSELWIRVQSGQMPPGNSDLTLSEVDMIATWIDEGALSQPGCMDPEAYNCESSLNGDYVTELGGIPYDNSCADCSSDGVCDGYYGSATECYYNQAPAASEITFTIDASSISLDWSQFTPPALSSVVDYRVVRCTGDNCAPPNNVTGTNFTDVFEYDEESDLKYVISVNYENNPYWGWANGEAAYPFGGCGALGDMNGDGGWNVLDIVALANCVLGSNCGDIDNGCAGDMNGDGGWNVLDIVALANCVLASNCSDL